MTNPDLNPVADDPNHVLQAPSEPVEDRNDDTIIDQSELDKMREGPQDESSSEPSSEAPEATEESSLDETLLAEAKQYGFTEDDVADMDADRLRAVMAAVDRRSVEMFRQSQQSQQPQQDPYAQQPPQPQQPPAPTFPQAHQPQAQPPAPMPDEFKIELDEESYDPDLLKTIKGMHEHYQKHIQELSQGLQAQQMWYQQQMAAQLEQSSAQYTAWFDEQLSKLGEDFEAVFGKGAYDAQRRDTPEFSNREKLDAAIQTLAQVSPSASDEELFNRALRMEFGDTLTKLERQKLSQQLRNGQRKTIGRAANRRIASQETDVDPQSGHPLSAIEEVQRELDQMLQGG